MLVTRHLGAQRARTVSRAAPSVWEARSHRVALSCSWAWGHRRPPPNLERAILSAAAATSQLAWGPAVFPGLAMHPNLSRSTVVGRPPALLSSKVGHIMTTVTCDGPYGCPFSPATCPSSASSASGPAGDPLVEAEKTCASSGGTVPPPQPVTRALRIATLSPSPGQVLAIVCRFGLSSSVDDSPHPYLAFPGCPLLAGSAPNDSVSPHLCSTACSELRWRSLAVRRIGFVLQDALVPPSTRPHGWRGDRRCARTSS